MHWNHIKLRRGASPLELPDTRTRGGPVPRSVRVARSAALASQCDIKIEGFRPQLSDMLRWTFARAV